MMGFFRFLLVSLAFTLGTINFTHAASFDCNKATTETEIAICNDPELSKLDELLGISFQKLLAKFPLNSDVILIEQKQWINSQTKCLGDLNCLNWLYSNWFSEFSFNMSSNYHGITAPELDGEANTIKFDRRTCEFSQNEDAKNYNCSSSLSNWDRGYKSCSFNGYVIQIEKTNNGANLLLWEKNFSYSAGKDPIEIINLQYASGGNPFRFWIEGSISNTSLGVLGDHIYIAPPDNFGGPYPLYKMGNGSSDWEYYDTNFSDLVPKMAMLLVMVDEQIPNNCVAQIKHKSSTNQSSRLH